MSEKIKWCYFETSNIYSFGSAPVGRAHRDISTRVRSFACVRCVPWLCGRGAMAVCRSSHVLLTNASLELQCVLVFFNLQTVIVPLCLRHERSVQHSHLLFAVSFVRVRVWGGLKLSPVTAPSKARCRSQWCSSVWVYLQPHYAAGNLMLLCTWGWG